MERLRIALRSLQPTAGVSVLVAFLLVGLTWETTTAMADAPDTVARSVRVACMNVSLYGETTGQIAARLEGGADGQGIKLARIIRAVRPDILLLCEIDYDKTGLTLNRFADLYLNASRDEQTEPIDYPHRWSIPSNTGVIAGHDLDPDGQTNLPSDAWGFGNYPGQYAMALLSRYPIDRENIRSFQTFLWANLPAALRPIDPGTGIPFHSNEVWKKLRLSSKNHVDIPIVIERSAGKHRVLHLLASHPTPPVFDGAEDRNGCRNHDEIRFWRDYVSTPTAAHLVDDDGVTGGLAADESFVIAGDLNSDPQRGASRRAGIADLLACRRIQDVAPRSEGHGSATALFGKQEVRVDYVLPSTDLDVLDSGVVWPMPNTFLGRALDATDHRMVWVEIE